MEKYFYLIVKYNTKQLCLFLPLQTSPKTYLNAVTTQNVRVVKKNGKSESITPVLRFLKCFYCQNMAAFDIRQL